MKRILAIAPHPDDETLGCGGTLLRHAREGAEIHWLIATRMTRASGFPEDRIAEREREIDAVATHYGFATTHRLDFPTMTLDSIPLKQIVDAVGEVISATAPDTILLPFPGDAHSDHGIVFHAGAACTKWFRYPGIRTVLVYETLSETAFGLQPHAGGFRPGVFVDITGQVDGKIAAMRLYSGEMAEAPFPRSEQAIRALAVLRGSTAGFDAAEAFMPVYQAI